MSAKYKVTLEKNSAKVVGRVWPNAAGLWEAHSDVFDAPCGPFGTRHDAEVELVDMWERSFDRHWMPYGGFSS